MNNKIKKESHSEAFVSFIIERMRKDKGIAAALRRADNSATEYQSWEHLSAFNIELDKSYKRLPYAIIAAAIAKAKIEKNGTVGIGQALASCYADGNNSDQAKGKFRRLLACHSVEEVCRIIRPLLSLIDAKSQMRLDYSSLLNDLAKFHNNSQAVKSRWAQNFYARSAKVEKS